MKIWDNKIKGMIEFTSSPVGQIRILKAGGLVDTLPANRAERRRLARAQRHQLP